MLSLCRFLAPVSAPARIGEVIVNKSISSDAAGYLLDCLFGRTLEISSDSSLSQVLHHKGTSPEGAVTTIHIVCSCPCYNIMHQPS